MQISDEKLVAVSNNRFIFNDLRPSRHNNGQNDLGG